MLKKWWPTIKALVVITLGSFIFSIGINGFIVPHKLVSGGISGVALMLFYVTGIQIGTLNLLLNIPILYATYRFLGRWYLWITIFGTAMCSLAINWLSFLQQYHFTQDPIVGSILGGIFSGFGLGIIYRVGGNTGGLDPIAFIVRKYYGLQLGSVVFVLNCAVLIAASTIVGIEAATITLISLYLSATVTNKLVTGFNQRKALFIISYHTKEVCDMIMYQIGRGATILHGEGAYTHKDKQVIMCVVGLMQVAKLKDEIHKVDPSAFLLITDAAEVIGQGFTFGAPKINPQMAEAVLAQQHVDVNTVETSLTEGK